MFLFGKKHLEIKEIDKNTILTPSIHLKYLNNNNGSRLAFSSLRLHIAIARSLLSKDLSNFDLIFEATSSLLRYQTIINTPKTCLTLNKVNFEILRDFTQKTRIGELAQGLTYLLAQEHLEYPIVVDFEGFLKYKNPQAKYDGETPDYILQKEDNYNISLIESKGHYASQNNSTKGKLKKSLDQCKNGISIISNNLHGYIVEKTYGVCSKLYNESDSNVSELQFVDPDFPNKNNSHNIELLQYHYASWFLLMGNIPVYEKLINGQFVTNEDIKTGKEKNIKGKLFYMFSFRYSFRLNFYHFPFYHYIPKHLESYGIRMEVMNILMGKEDAYSEIKFKLDLNKENDKKNFEYFNDGTIVNSTQQWL